VFNTTASTATTRSTETSKNTTTTFNTIRQTSFYNDG